MEMTDDFLEEHDLDWFALFSDGVLAHFASAGRGAVPAKVRCSLSGYEAVFRFFEKLESRFEVEVAEKAIPEFASADQRSRYLSSFVRMAEKGLCSYDFSNSCYRLVARPRADVRVDLPDSIKGRLTVLPFVFSEEIHWVS